MSRTLCAADKICLYVVCINPPMLCGVYNVSRLVSFVKKKVKGCRTVFVLPTFYGESVEVLIHGSDLSYLSFVKTVIVSLSQERAIESIVTMVKIV